jgi:hypothetical protein
VSLVYIVRIDECIREDQYVKGHVKKEAMSDPSKQGHVAKTTLQTT